MDFLRVTVTNGSRLQILFYTFFAGCPTKIKKPRQSYAEVNVTYETFEQIPRGRDSLGRDFA